MGGSVVRWSGRAYEALTAAAARRTRRDLFHSAIEVHLGDETVAIEMAPAWTQQGERGVVARGPVGSRFLGRWKPFCYEVRCWHSGSIPDVSAAVGGPNRLTDDPHAAELMLELVPQFPPLTWGRDESRVGDMWNSNSLTAWLLVRAGLDTRGIEPPFGGRAPGWGAGLTVASRVP